MTATLTAPKSVDEQRSSSTPRDAAGALRTPTMIERTLAMLLWLNAAPANAQANLQERRRNGAGPVVVIFVVAIAVLLVLAAAVSAAVVIYCANKGMNFEWYVKTSWFEVKVACSK
ncbi:MULTISPECIES: hypothetical protein [Kocuria]|uniref:hypothetical protein n=1 Tax=Kocuria TaxID=57493 RepID=UPI0018F7026B|nr:MULTISPECIES: hypothetical protein [Kocuria]